MIALYAVSVAVVFLLGYLAQQERVYVRYEIVLISFAFVCLLLIDGARYRA